MRSRTAAALLLLSACGAPGAESRAPWQNTALRGTPDPPPPMIAVPAFPRLPVKRPVCIECEPGSNRILVLENFAWEEYRTVLKRFTNAPDAAEMETLLVIPGDQELAYSLCFHPQFAKNGYLYLGTNGKGPGDKHHSRIVRYTMAREAPWQLIEGSRQVVIEWPSNGHNGAAAAFGNDGMLYVTSGDGTPNSDSANAGQDTSSLLAKVLRLDVDGAPAGQAYRVPPDNPFMGNAAVRPETWAYGLRNPWRITSDPVSGQIWVGQNGQDLREYAHLLERGANYGWSEYEGSRVFQAGRLRGPAPFTPPTIEHDHAAFRSLTGGFVYRGARFPKLTGAYLYGDYGTGRVWAAKHDGTRLLWNRELADTAASIAGFCSNTAGDILIADHLGHRVLRLEPAPVPDPKAPPFPQQLRDTGLFTALDTLTPATGVQAYQINAPSWHDGAESQYFIALPAGEGAAFTPVTDGAWAWKSLTPPNGTALVQTLTLPAADGKPARRVETRLLLRREADWMAYSWIWNDAQTDATLAPAEGCRLTLDGRDWQVPSRSDCVLCHARGANYALGLTPAQLHRDGQLERLAAAGFTQALPKPPAEIPRLTHPHDASAPLARRMQSWFAVNCSHCHRHEGGGNSLMDLSPWVEGASQHLIDAPPQHGDYQMPGARLIAPGEPGRSVLPVRVSSRGPGQMPPVGTIQPDPQGLSLLYQWLQSTAAK